MTREVGRGHDARERRAAAGEVGGLAARLVGRRLEVPPEVVVLTRALGRDGHDVDRRQLGGEPFVEACRQEARGRSAAAHVVAERLQIATREVGAVASGRRDDAERDRVGADDEHRALTVHQVRDRPHVRVEDAEVVRHLDVEAGRPGELGFERLEIERARPLLEGDFRSLHGARQARRDLPAAVRSRASGEEHAGSTGNTRCHQERDSCAPAPVVGRDRGEIEPDELREQALVLEQRLVGTERRGRPETEERSRELPA